MSNIQRPFAFASITVFPLGNVLVEYSNKMAELSCRIKAEIEEGSEAYVVELATNEVRMMFHWERDVDRYQVFTEELGHISNYVPTFHSMISGGVQ